MAGWPADAGTTPDLQNEAARQQHGRIAADEGELLLPLLWARAAHHFQAP
jgi:hypothetical protein